MPCWFEKFLAGNIEAIVLEIIIYFKMSNKACDALDFINFLEILIQSTYYCDF